MEFNRTEEAPMSEAQIVYFRTRIAEAVAARMILGLTYEEATREAHTYCMARWPKLTTAAFGA